MVTVRTGSSGHPAKQEGKVPELPVGGAMSLACVLSLPKEGALFLFYREVGLGEMTSPLFLCAGDLDLSASSEIGLTSR